MHLVDLSRSSTKSHFFVSLRDQTRIKNGVDAKPIVQDFSLSLIGWLSRLSSVIIVESAALLAAVIGQESRGQAKKVPRIFPIGEGNLSAGLK